MPPILPCCWLWAGSNKFTSVFWLLKGNLKDVHKGDLFWLSWGQDYSTVEQLSICLLHCCGITLQILPSQETYHEETRVMMPHSPGDFITDMEKFFSIISNSVACPLAFKQWPDQTRQFCSRSFVDHCFVGLAFYFGQFAKAFNCLYHHFCQEVTCSAR